MLMAISKEEDLKRWIAGRILPSFNNPHHQRLINTLIYLYNERSRLLKETGGSTEWPDAIPMSESKEKED